MTTQEYALFTPWKSKKFGWKNHFHCWKQPAKVPRYSTFIGEKKKKKLKFIALPINSLYIGNCKFQIGTKEIQ